MILRGPADRLVYDGEPLVRSTPGLILEDIWQVPCTLALDWILANRAIRFKTLALQGFQPSFQMSS